VMLSATNHYFGIYNEAKKFLTQLYSELKKNKDELADRLKEVSTEIIISGTYKHTTEELQYGVKMAWRNAAKCIGRIQWKNITVRDMRHVKLPNTVFNALIDHIRQATNKGNIKSVMTVFAPKKGDEIGCHIWNNMLIRYCGYINPDGTILGDPASVALTSAIMKLGWEPPKTRSAYDILPIVIEMQGQLPVIFELPKDIILEVELEHPKFTWFKDLKLKWYTVPAIADFRTEIGGIHYTMCPFNGWYMETEISRNLLEEDRYNMLHVIGDKMDLDTTSPRTMWKDEVMLQFNKAVVHSFIKNKVTLVDHHTASMQFLQHERQEAKCGRETPADWAWIVPPTSGSLCPVWHHAMRNFVQKPGMFRTYDTVALKAGTKTWTALPEITKQPKSPTSVNLNIIYGSETGTAERYAEALKAELSSSFPSLALREMDDVDMTDINKRGGVLLVITSTFGQGEPPGNAINFSNWMTHPDLPEQCMNNLAYAVFGLGNTMYPDYCKFATDINKKMGELGATVLSSLGKGDELDKQEQSFKAWMKSIILILREKYPDSFLDNELSTSETTSESHMIAQYAISGKWIGKEESKQFNKRKSKATLKHTPGTRQGFPVKVTITKNDELHKEASPRSTRHIELDISDTAIPGMYKSGDHIAVYPSNSLQTVKSLARRLDVDPKGHFYVPGYAAWSLPMSVMNAFRTKVELALHNFAPSQLLFFFKQLLPYCTADDNPTITKFIRQLKREDRGELVKEVLCRFPTVLEFLEHFEKIKVPFGVFITSLPLMKPRFYSISSSPSASPNNISITVAVTTIELESGYKIKGVCSHFLASKKVGSNIQIYWRKSNFHLPENPIEPIIMVGPGTGLAPFRGFWCERGQLKKWKINLGSAMLFFGCRNKAHDYIYEKELAEAAKGDGYAISELHVAFSRQTENKVYVQDKLLENSKRVYDLLKKGSRIYVCGDIKMADQVYDTFLTIVKLNKSKEPQNADDQDPVDFLESLVKNGRYKVDAWGVTLHSNTVTKEVRDQLYKRAHRWLDGVKKSMKKSD